MSENQEASPSAADLLLHPVRLRIVQTLVGRPMTPLQLRDALGDVPQATLYRQINVLADGSLIGVVDERPVRGGVERTYAVVEDAVQLGPDDLAAAERDDHLRFFTTFLGSLLTGYGRYLDSPDADPAGETGYRQVPLWMDEGEFAEFASELSELLRRGYENKPGPGRRRRLVSTISFPDIVTD